jgi:hypothetical protein
MGSGLRRAVSVDWKLSERPSFCCETDSTVARGCLVSVGEVGVDMLGSSGVSLAGSVVLSASEDMAL